MFIFYAKIIIFSQIFYFLIMGIGKIRTAGGIGEWRGIKCLNGINYLVGEVVIVF